jgi:hypothetical protein
MHRLCGKTHTFRTRQSGSRHFQVATTGQLLIHIMFRQCAPTRPLPLDTLPSVICSLTKSGRTLSTALTSHSMGTNGFGSPTGRAVGIGYVEEVYARLQGHLYNLPPGSTQVNTTLDEMSSIFSLNQTLSFDFSHDTNIMFIITAFGLGQFNQTLPTSGPPANQQLIVSYMEPFGANVVFEVYQDASTCLGNTFCQLDHSEDVRLLHQWQCYYICSPHPQPADSAAG